MENKSIFEHLNGINVNDKTEKKNGLTYLSWAWAWAEFKKICPDATYEVVKFNGLPYAYDENTGYMVYTTVTAGGITYEMWLPVMDGSNRAMKNDYYEYTVKNPLFKFAKKAPDGKYYDKYGNEQKEYIEKGCEPATMFDVNKAIMRCLTKNLAMFGLGLYIYAGEDLPEADRDNMEVLATKKDRAEKDELESSPAPVRCDHCGSVILRAKGNNGRIVEPEEIKEKCGGLCPTCYKEMKANES